MSDEQDHARKPPAPSDEPGKTPSSLPGPNRFPDKDRFGEALAPGTVPDDERKEREEDTDGRERTPGGVERP